MARRAVENGSAHLGVAVILLHVCHEVVDFLIFRLLPRIGELLHREVVRSHLMDGWMDGYNGWRSISAS